MKTQAAVLYDINKPLRIEELIIPELNSGQVLVEVVFSGICRSQLNEIQGLKGKDKYLPHTLGHEGAGIVEQVGPDVKKVRPGDHVVLTWIKGKGIDASSTIYTGPGGIRINSGALSTFMTKAVISENRLVKIAKEFSLRQASLFGCAIPTGTGIIFNTLHAKRRNSVVIIGVGGIGMSAIIGASLAECRKIIAVDILDWKLNLAKKLGATDTLNAKKQDIHTAIMNICAGKGVDFVVEASGTKETMEMGLGLVHNKGTVAIAGNLAKNKKIMIAPFELIKGKRIIGTWGGETKPDIDIPLYMKRITSKGLKLERLISHEFRLKDINQALSKLEKGRMARALIDLKKNR